MSKIQNTTNVNTYATNNGNNSDGDNNLYKVKLAFSPQELGVKGNRPQTIVLTEQQVESKIFEKYGFNPKNRLQIEMLKLRFDTKNSPYSEIDWGSGKFVAQLNSSGQYEISVGLRERTLEALEGRLINAPTNNNNGNLSDTTASRTGYDASRLKQKQLQQNLPTPDLTGLTPEQKELVLDLTQVGLSVVGIFDPTGIADGTDAVISVGRGDYWGAGISALGIIPYLGDIAKIGKLPKLLKTIEKVVDVAKQSPAFAKVVEPLLKGLKASIDKLPIDKLPNWAKEPIQSMKNKIDEFFKKPLKTEEIVAPASGKTVKVYSDAESIVPVDKIEKYVRGKVDVDISAVKKEIRELNEFKNTQRKLFDQNPDNAKRLETLKKMQHNFERSDAMRKSLEAIGLVDTPKNNQLIAEHLLNVGKQVTEANRLDVPSILQGPNGSVKVLSTWSIVDGKPYLSTIKLITIK